MTKPRLSALAALLMLAFVVALPLAHAQQDTETPAEPASPQTAGNDPASTAGMEYAPLGVASLSDVLFRKGVLKTDDSIALEEYVRIHNCGVYEQYGKDEFAWARIRESMGRDLDIRLQDFPEGLEIQNTIYLQQYDLTTNQFPVEAISRIKDTRRLMLIETNGSILPCGSSKFQRFYPRVHPTRAILRVDQAINLVTIPVNRKIADRVIAEMNDRTNIMEEERRSVLAVMRVRVTGVDPLAVASIPTERTLVGQIDELLVYEGPARKILIFKKDYRSQRVEEGSK